MHCSGLYYGYLILWDLLIYCWHLLLASRYGILPFLGATYFTVILYVPLLLLTHFMVFQLLLKKAVERLFKD